MRICSECKKKMNKGYCIENGMEYYCCEECLNKHYTEEEYLSMYDNGEGDSYYTEWESDFKIINDKQMEYLKERFNVYESESEFELESWTDGGVDMFIHIDKESNKKVVEQLREFIDNFDIDDEIDIHRQDKAYCDAFRITDSVKDFEGYVEFLEDVLYELDVLENSIGGNE